MKKLLSIPTVAMALITSASAAPFYSATPGNTALFTNGVADNGLMTLSGATPNLILNNNNGAFNHGGFSSMESMSTLLGTALDATDAVALTLTVDSIGGSGELRANGIFFGMAGAAALTGGRAPSLLLQIEAGNNGSDVAVSSSFTTGGDAGFNALQSSLEDGFSITLTANRSGYQFELSDIVTDSGATSSSVEGTFGGTEFVDHFNGGRFYFSAQKWNNGNIELDISKASVEEVPFVEISTPLETAIFRLKDHITGTVTLNSSAINNQAGIINTYADEVGNTSGSIAKALDLVATYESIKGALFINGTTRNGFSRTDKSSTDKALAHAMFAVYQAIVDDVYNADNLATYRDLIGNYKFVSANFWPGAASPPANPNAVYSVPINASQPTAWGYPVDFGTQPARRPTGAYLAPGSIATVTVPQALVGKGFEIRVGSHVADLKNRPNEYKRLNRVTVTYPITATATEIAHPLGGGIYIEVPYEVEEGVVNIEFQNTIRSPFFSSTPHRQISLTEWQNTERLHPGPWADFESEKFMLNVPTDWIYAYNDPITLINKWDLAMDACSDLQGLPRVRPKTVLYCQIDATLDANAFSPGYPQSNDNYTPSSTAGGNKNHDYLNGPKFAGYEILHELGHAASITKFNGEVEALVNFLYTPVHNRMFDVPFEVAFGRSIGGAGTASVSRDQAALLWILSDKFRAGEFQNTQDMKYQHRGYGKYAEIAAVFGWDALGDFWKSVAIDYENGISYPKNTDPPASRIIRMSRAANANLLPLIQMWGVAPGNRSQVQSTLDSEGIKPSAAIYDRLVHYQSIVPQNTSQFNSHYQKVKDAPIDRDFFDARRSNWNASLAADSISKVQEIIDLYFPNGRPIESLPHFEDFEDGIGGWAQATDDHYEWRRHTGETFSGAAGPVAAAGGDYYMYAEGHDAPASEKTASFQCTFDVSGVVDAEMQFDYHMYGSFIDFLTVDVHDGNSWTLDIWRRTGQQHSGSSEAWSSAEVDLSAFNGNSEMTIRFRTKNKQWFSADPAIDNISIQAAPAPPQTLPYAESFETGMGAWVQSQDDNFDWTHHSGGTETSFAGPSGASEGDFYLYAEGHHNLGSNKTASVECRFDLSGVVAPELTFDYHMFGTYIAFLAVDIHDGSAWTNDVWIRNGQQHSSSTVPWSEAEVDLTAYAGNSEVMIRFRTANAQWNGADPAIDNLRLEETINGYGNWALTAFAGAAGGTDQSETGDPDGDGFTNEMEWALLMNPLTTDCPAVDFDNSGTEITLSYDRMNPTITGINVFASWSETLLDGSWKLHGDGMTESSLGWAGDIETMGVTLTPYQSKAFIRIHAVKQ